MCVCFEALSPCESSDGSVGSFDVISPFFLSTVGKLFLFSNNMADTRRRVKLYMLNEDRQWDDRGTGHVSSAYVERLRGMSLLVRSETDGKLKLNSRQ